MCAEAKVPCQANWSEPEFCGEVVPIHMYVGRLVGLVAVKVKTIRARPQDGWHCRSELYSPLWRGLAAVFSIPMTHTRRRTGYYSQSANVRKELAMGEVKEYPIKSFGLPIPRARYNLTHLQREEA